MEARVSNGIGLFLQYTAHATAKAVGQLGQLTTPEGVDQTLALPKALGGTGKGQNPEQLLAMGYAGASISGSWLYCIYSSPNRIACLLEAIRLAARALGRKDDAKELVIHTSVHIGEPKDLGGFGFAIDIEVEGVDEELLQRGHEVRLQTMPHLHYTDWIYAPKECPYSRALKDNVEINVRRA